MAKEATPSNGFDASQVQSIVTRIENIHSEIRSVKASNAKRCRELLDDVKDIMEEAKSAGIPKKELKANLKAIELASKLQAVREELEPDEQEVFDQLAVALGPLGEHARAVYEATAD